LQIKGDSAIVVPEAGLKRSPQPKRQGGLMTWTVPLSASSREAGSPTIQVGQQWVALANDGVAAITIIRRLDIHDDAWFVDASTGQPHAMTSGQIMSGYRLVVH